MGEKAIVTCAVVGAEVTREQSPAVPYTPEEIARASLDAWREGAAVVHLHARHPDGRPSQGAAHFREIVDRIRSAGSDLVIQCSTGGAVGMSVEERLGSLVAGAEMATLNMGTLNFGDDVFVNSRPDIVRIARRIRERGLVTECENLRRGHAGDSSLAPRQGAPGASVPRSIRAGGPRRHVRDRAKPSIPRGRNARASPLDGGRDWPVRDAHGGALAEAGGARAGRTRG